MGNCKMTVPFFLAASASALGQTSPIYTVEKGLPAFTEDLSTAPALAVGTARVVVAGTHGLRLYDKVTGVLLDDELWGPSHPAAGYPFQPRNDPGSSFLSMSLAYPRADYDPISGRTWMMFSEFGGFVGEHYEPTGGNVCAPYLHLAVNKFDNGMTTFSQSEWWYYTGEPSTPGNGGEAFDFESPSLARYQSDPSHTTLRGNVMVPTLGFDDRAIFVTASDNGVCVAPELTSGTNPAIVVIPREHEGGTKSILTGDRPNESLMTIARLGSLLTPDNANNIMAVQEPYEQYPNMTLFISTDGTTAAGVIMENIRLRGMYNAQPNPAQPAGNWLIRQSLKLNMSGTDVVLADMSVSADWPQLQVGPPMLATPSQFPLAPGGFRPFADSDAFMSAVLTKDNQGNPRVFAVHASLDATGEGDGWVVQWYIIDPKIDDFFTLAPEQDTSWNPEIVRAGRIEADESSNDGDCSLPVLAVTRSGQVYIEYTFSNGSTYPKILRAILNNTYTGVQSTTVVKAGPASGYGAVSDKWALYGDMQADPTGCNFWSTHTLVEDGGERAVWLFKRPFLCFTTDMNADGFTDTFDMAAYNDLYTTGDRRSDTDADGEIDASDMATFIDAYDAATGP